MRRGEEGVVRVVRDEGALHRDQCVCSGHCLGGWFRVYVWLGIGQYAKRKLVRGRDVHRRDSWTAVMGAMMVVVCGKVGLAWGL